MVTAEVKGVTKYYDEVSKTWTPENELPEIELWDEFSNRQKKMWLYLYNNLKKAKYLGLDKNRRNEDARLVATKAALSFEEK